MRPYSSSHYFRSNRFYFAPKRYLLKAKMLVKLKFKVPSSQHSPFLRDGKISKMIYIRLLSYLAIY